MAEEVVDRRGNWILVESEPCRACGRESREMHPAGVVPGRWLCSCGHRQSDPINVYQNLEWRARLEAVSAKHNRAGGPDEQQLADQGRTS